MAAEKLITTSSKIIPFERQFQEIMELIYKSKEKALRNVNAELISLYWQIGGDIYKRVKSAEWGEGVVDQLAEYINTRHPELKGFNRRGLYRMRQFYEAYFEDKIVSPLVTQSKTKISSFFKDTYILDFLNLPDNHSELDLQKAIIKNLKKFILEFGKDFTFVGEEYRVQVGAGDFFVDLLFFHRELQCLVAFELKVDEFKPEYLGKLNFYLEALDRDVKKAHENPSVGIILCKCKNDEVVEYALSRSLSPAMIAEYRTKLIDKNKLQEKLHEFFLLSEDKNSSI